MNCYLCNAGPDDAAMLLGPPGDDEHVVCAACFLDVPDFVEQLPAVAEMCRQALAEQGEDET